MSTTMVVERVRAAAAQRSALRIHGAGSWLDAGRPVSAASTLSVADDRGIVEYVPGDLTMTARAGSTIEELDQAARAHDQWLPLSPWGGRASTLRAPLATGSAGPYTAAFGLPRDVVLGLEFVTGTGDIVRSGGRVVKNVAGFDLTRLVTGSWGTLGVITEATLRLRARPLHSRSVLLRVNDADTTALANLCAAIRALPFAPFVCEMLGASLASRLGLPANPVILLEIGGNATALAAQLDLVRTLGPTEDAPDGIVDRLRTADDSAAATWRVSGKPTQFPALWREAATIPGALAHGSPVRGVVRVIAGPGTLPPSRTATGLVIEKMPAAAWSAFPSAPDQLSEDVRAKFDPSRILNPGILGGVA